MSKKERPTNAGYSRLPEFTEKCRQAGVEPSRRQASKYRNGKGKVWNFFNKKEEHNG